MAFVRMLPVAWLASLYAAILVMLLIFFLNPALGFNLSTLASLAPFALLMSLPPTLFWPAGYRFVRIFARRRLRVRWLSFKYLLGFACANLVVVTGLFWYNANFLEALLPEGLVSRLRFGAGLLSLVTLGWIGVASVKRLRGRRKVRIACYLVAGLLPPVLALLRGGNVPGPASLYRPELVSPSPESPRLLLLGIEGATLDQVLPLVAQGKLPNLARLLQSGAHGRLTSFRPCVSEVAWESLFTGKIPAKHQVLDSFRYRLPLGAGEVRLAPRGLFFHPLAGISGLAASPQSPAESHALTIMQILDRLGYAALTFRAGDVPVPAGAGQDIALERFLNPEVPTPPGTRELRDVLRSALAQDEAIASVSLRAWEDHGVRGVVVLLPGLDKVSHHFLRYAMPASFGDVPHNEVEKYGRVLEAYYRYLDLWIGRFLAACSGAGEATGAGENSLVLVVSPHGIDPLPLARRLLVFLEGQRFESGYHGRAPDGMIVAAGPGVAHGKPLGRSSILDVTPTLLYDLKLPIGLDMDGHPLTRLFQEATLQDKPVLLIPSYEGSRLPERAGEPPGLPLTGDHPVVR